MGWTRTREEDDFFETAVVVVACRIREWLVDIGVIKVENWDCGNGR